MGNLPGFPKDGELERPYEQISVGAQLRAAIGGMHLLRELRDNSDLGDRKAARKCLGTAGGKAIFLGFAYAQENLEALDLVHTCLKKTAYGTTYGIDEGEPTTELTERLKTFGITLSAPWPFDVYTALRKYPLTILGPPRTG